jgi:hypothetical protein
MASVLELARYANVSAENVLRVVHGEPVSEDVAQRVATAMEALGPPPSPRATAPALPAEVAVEPRHEELLERFTQAAAELQASLPQGVSSVVYEALRVEVRPVAQDLAELGALFEEMLRRLEQVGSEVGAERRERVEDVALLTELVTTGWRTVDRRLARLEQILSRLEERPSGKLAARVIRLEEQQNRRAVD